MYFRLILTACAPCTHAQICGTHAGRNALASAPASSPRAGARAAPRTHVSQSEARSKGGTAVTHEGDDEEGEEKPPQVFGPVCSYQECYAKCTNRCTLIEMFHVRGEHTVHISNVRRYGKFMQYYEHLRIMQYYEHLRGLPVCYHCACTAASQEVRNRTFARCFPQTGVGKAR